MIIYDETPTDDYFYAYICKNGHEQKLEDNKYCTDCGAQVITECQTCFTKIRRGTIESEPLFLNPYEPEEFSGYEYHEIPFEDYKIPSYCHECGKPYPWVQKFLDDYKQILELQADEINADLQSKIYTATEEALKNKFTGNSLMILGLMYKKVAPSVQSVLISVLSNVASTKVIENLIQK